MRPAADVLRRALSNARPFDKVGSSPERIAERAEALRRIWPPPSSWPPSMTSVPAPGSASPAEVVQELRYRLGVFWRTCGLAQGTKEAASAPTSALTATSRGPASVVVLLRFAALGEQSAITSERHWGGWLLLGGVGSSADECQCTPPAACHQEFSHTPPQSFIGSR